MTKRALVAGGAGFVGSHLCELLLTEGHQVVAVDCLVTGREANVEPLKKFGSAFQLIKHDITQPVPSEIANGAKFDEIYNLASPASPVDFDAMPIFIMRTGSEGQRNMLELAKAHGSRILFASSSEVYGDAEQHPQSETYFGNVNPIGHRGCYDEAKRYGEALSQSYWREFQTPIRIARIFNTYGPRMRPNDGRIIPNFFTQALKKQSLTVYGDGKQTRSFCFVTDLVRGFHLLMKSSETRPVNLGNPTERSVLEMAETVNKLTGNTAPLKFLPLPENDPKLRRPDTARAQEVLGWKPAVDLEKGLALTLDYFKSELARDPSIEATVLG